MNADSSNNVWLKTLVTPGRSRTGRQTPFWHWLKAIVSADNSGIKKPQI